jgi:hypothetical protein
VHGILDLLEREEELLALDAALARAREGHGLVGANDGERDRWLSGAAGLTHSMFEDAGAGKDESSYARLHGLYWLCANLAADLRDGQGGAAAAGATTEIAASGQTNRGSLRRCS